MKIDIDHFREIADSLTRNKSRSLLTGFGVFWGVFMLLIMLGGGQGFKKMMGNVFTGFATNSGIIASDETTKAYAGFGEGRWWTLNNGDIERIRQTVPELDIVTPTAFVSNSQIVYGENSSRGMVQGVYPDYAKIEEPRLKYTYTLFNK